MVHPQAAINSEYSDYSEYSEYSETMNYTKLCLTLLGVLSLCTACREGDDPADDLAVVRSSLNFPSKGATGEIEVSTSKPYTAVADKEWCSIAVEGNLVRVSVTKNGDFESRSATITLTSGTKRLRLPVSQMGSIWAIRGADSYLTSDEDTTLTIPATLDFEYTVSMPEWIEGQEVEDGYQLHLLDNDTGAGREGIVTFTSIVGSKVITFRQFGTKSVCGSYKATYVNAKEKAVTQDVTLAASDTRGMLILKGLHAKYDIPLIMKSDGTLRVEGSGLVEHNNTIGYLFTVLHCTDGTDFTTQGYYYDAPLTLTRTNNVLVPSFTFATTTINYKDMFEQDMTATVDGFTLKTYTYPTVSYFFEDQVLGQYTNLRLEKNK